MNLNEKIRKVAGHYDSAHINKGKYDDVENRIIEEEYRKLKLENDAIEGNNISDSQDRDQRKDFAERIFSFVALYMFAVFFILILSGGPFNFRLSDNVLITLLGTTTANVIGILIIVVTYLFSRKKK